MREIEIEWQAISSFKFISLLIFYINFSSLHFHNSNNHGKVKIADQTTVSGRKTYAMTLYGFHSQCFPIPLSSLIVFFPF